MRRKRAKSPLKQATLESRRRAPFRGWMCENCQEKKVNWQYKKTEREIQFEIILILFTLKQHGIGVCTYSIRI